MMLIALADMIQAHQMNITGVLHVGAHEGEEAAAYQNAGIHNVWWVEGNPELIDLLTKRIARARVGPGHRIINALVTDVDGDDITFHVTNNMQSSSILEFGTHRRVSPDVHFTHDLTLLTRTLESLIDEHNINANFWNLDIQGAELLALEGAGERIQMADYVYTEINVDELYRGCVRLPELDQFFDGVGFVRCDTRLAGPRVGWGDALYVRRGVRP